MKLQTSLQTRDRTNASSRAHVHSVADKLQALLATVSTHNLRSIRSTLQSLEDTMNHNSIPSRGKIFISPQRPGRFRGPPILECSAHRRLFFWDNPTGA